MFKRSKDSPALREERGAKLAVQPQQIDKLNRQYFNILTQISARKRLAYIQAGHVGETELVAHSVEEAEKITGRQVVFKSESEVGDRVEIHLWGRVLIQQPFHIDELRQRIADRPFDESPVGFLRVRGEPDHRIDQRFGYDLLNRNNNDDTHRVRL